MSACRILLTAFTLSVAAAFAPPLLRAQEAPAAADVETKSPVVGVINANNVFVHSAPRDAAYPTMKLDKGAEVTVVGMKNDWLKIVPPAGSFSYYPKMAVQLHGDGKVAKVIQSTNVRAGSVLQPVKVAVQTKLDEGADVTILGEQDEYYKIAPPAGAFLWIHEKSVDAVRRLKPEEAAKPEVAIAKTASNDAAPSSGEHAAAETPSDPRPNQFAMDPGPATTQSAPESAPSATQPAQAAANLGFDELEAEFKAAGEKPITEQPIDQLTQGYQALAGSGQLSNLEKRVVDARLSALKTRTSMRDDFVNVKKAQEQLRERQKSLQAEREEIDDRIKQKNVTIYAAVGTLRTSSLQQGETTLYRLTDPSTGRTLVYLRTNEPKYAALLNKFVGVKGDLNNDEQLNLKVIAPTAAEAVDPAKVNTTVAAQIIPPSMLPRATEASTGNQ